MDIPLSTDHASPLIPLVPTITNSDVCEYLEKIFSGAYTPEDEEHLESQLDDPRAEAVVTIANSVLCLEPFTLIKVCAHIMKEGALPEDCDSDNLQTELAFFNTALETLKDSGVTPDYFLNSDIERRVKEYSVSNLFLENYSDILNQLEFLGAELANPADMVQLPGEVATMYSSAFVAVNNALEHPDIQGHVIANRLITQTVKPQVEAFFPEVERLIKECYKEKITEIQTVPRDPILIDECIESLREVHLTLHRDEAAFEPGEVSVLSNRTERTALRDLLNELMNQPQLLRRHYSETSIALSILRADTSDQNPLFASREVFMESIQRPDLRVPTPPPAEPHREPPAPPSKRARWE